MAENSGMPWPDDDDLDDFDEYDEGYCPRCDGSGDVIICPDDMCRGIGGCDNPDNTCFMVCPDCGGAG